MEKNLISIDDSLTCTGFSVISRLGEVLLAEKISPSKKLSEDEKVLNITNTLLQIFKSNSIKIAVIESQFVGKNIKTALKLSRLRGAITYALLNNGCEIIHMTPSETRKVLLGNGKATKEEVAEYIIENHNNEVVSSIGPFSDKNNKDKTSDIYDAICIGLAYLKTLEE